MNWGGKIVLVFCVFVVGMLFMVFQSASQEIDLVVPDYYEKELKYQEVIDAANNTRSLGTAVECKLKKEFIEVRLPHPMQGKPLTGQVWLYCIADKKRDIKQEFTTANASFSLPIGQSKAGLYQLIINWQLDDQAYYHEEKIMLP
jgi:hypothetical protein